MSQLPHTGEVWISPAGRMAMAYWRHRSQGLPARVMKGLYLDAVLTAADAAGQRLVRFADQCGS
ncbi:hypothetical protein [Streptomyces sp. NPDC048442]|uniref:hypothetical protein n=1 Tax=Streptomyces sp. NPDC048442 TaxID=3154823 RepID=UPI0034237BD8